MTLLSSAYARWHVVKGTSNYEPTNIEKYIAIKLYVSGEEYETNLYFYKNGNRTYLEKPYKDIYRISSDAIEVLKDTIK